MNKKDKEKLKKFLHFYIRIFLNDAVNEFYEIENKKWDNLKYLSQSAEVLIEVLHIVQKEAQQKVQQEHIAISDLELKKIGK